MLFLFLLLPNLSAPIKLRSKGSAYNVWVDKGQKGEALCSKV